MTILNEIQICLKHRYTNYITYDALYRFKNINLNQTKKIYLFYDCQKDAVN